MGNEIKFEFNCPKCGTAAAVSATIDPISCAPDVRAALKPVGAAYIYQITSDQIENFIQQKARQFSPDIKVVCTPITTKEPKNPSARKDRKRYAFIKVAFSDAALEQKNGSWYEKIAESNIRLIPDLFATVVAKYKYDRDTVSKWLKDYRFMEYLEAFFGITGDLLEEIKDGCIPKMLNGNDGSRWIYFAAAPEKVLMDMLSEVKKDSPVGRMEIVNTTVIAKGQIAYTVNVYPNEMPVSENAHVRSILMGDQKN